jgi:hypothetical protein
MQTASFIGHIFYVMFFIKRKKRTKIKKEFLLFWPIIDIIAIKQKIFGWI